MLPDKKDRSAFNVNTIGTTNETKDGTTLTPQLPFDAPILIICEDRRITTTLQRTFRDAGLVTELATDMTDGCKAAQSGHFPVIFVTALFADGSWKRLLDYPNRYDQRFVIIVVATTFDLREWAEALEAGAFDVLDALHDLSEAPAAAKRALWAAYLKGAIPCSVSPTRRC